MARVNVYVPAGMKRLMEQHGINWSEVAREAWNRAIENEVKRDWLRLSSKEGKKDDNQHTTTL